MHTMFCKGGFTMKCPTCKKELERCVCEGYNCNTCGYHFDEKGRVNSVLADDRRRISFKIPKKLLFQV